MKDCQFGVSPVNYSDSDSALSPVAWSTGAQLMIFFCFRFPVEFLGRPGNTICHTTRCIC